MFTMSEAQGRARLPDVQFALPAPALRPLITTYYKVIAHGRLQDHLHPEWGNIRFTTAGEWHVRHAGAGDPAPQRCALFGPTDRTSLVSTPGAAATVGVGLTALGWSRLIAAPAHLHANRISDLETLHGSAARQLWEALQDADWPTAQRLLDAHFTALAAAAPPADPLIERVQAALVSGDLPPVPDFAAGLGLAQRSLERLCKRAFGFTPKRLLRRQRFLRTLAQIGDRLDQPLAVLLDGSYYDQSHFIREFRAYMGMTPGAYYDAPRQMMRRAAIERQRTAGAPLQGLHRPPHA
jgi:AraC-like DNA-binding protein